MAQEISLANTQVSANLMTLGISLQKKIADDMTFLVSTGINQDFDFERNMEDGVEAEMWSYPFIRTAAKKWYKRNEVKKENLKANSGNFFGLLTQLRFQSIERLSPAFQQSSTEFMIGPIWGLERNYASGIHLGLTLGPGLNVGQNIDPHLSLIGGIEFGFILLSK